MLTADLLVTAFVFLCLLVNRQSLYFLCAISLGELFYFSTSTDFSFSILSAILYSLIAYLSSRIKFELQMALCAYSVLYWFNALDFFLFPHETLFYVIFPYVVKLVDVYVIYHLINKEQKDVGFYSSSNCSFN